MCSLKTTALPLLILMAFGLSIFGQGATGADINATNILIVNKSARIKTRVLPNQGGYSHSSISYLEIAFSDLRFKG